MTENKWKGPATVVTSFVVALAGVAGCDGPSGRSGEYVAEQTGAKPAETEQAAAEATEARSIVALAPDEGEERWLGAASADQLGEGALINIKVDRVSVPYTSMMVATQRLAASGIPVHLHTFEDEVLYVVSGRGAALVGADREEVPIESGSVLYIPSGEWHGLRNADPENRMEILIVTTPVEESGLGDFFREAGVRQGHPPLDLSEEEFLALLSEYGMKVPEQ